MKVFRGLVLLAVVLLAGCRAERAAFRFQAVSRTNDAFSEVHSENRLSESYAAQSLLNRERNGIVLAHKTQTQASCPSAAVRNRKTSRRLKSIKNPQTAKTYLKLRRVDSYAANRPQYSGPSDEAIFFTLFCVIAGVAALVTALIIGSAIAAFVGLGFLFLPIFIFNILNLSL